jgi:general transcription factor IIIA
VSAPIFRQTLFRLTVSSSFLRRAFIASPLVHSCEMSTNLQSGVSTQVLGKRRQRPFVDDREFVLHLSSSDAEPEAGPSMFSIPVYESPSSNPSKPYCCKFDGCTKAYKKPSRLAEHERSHTGEVSAYYESFGLVRLSEITVSSGRSCVQHATSLTCVRHILLLMCVCICRSPKSRSIAPRISVRNGSGPRSIFVYIWKRTQARSLSRYVSFVFLARYLTDDRFIKCTASDCYEAFFKHHQLRSHIATAHSPPGTKSYICSHDGCIKSFSTNQKLKAHAKVHEGMSIMYLPRVPSCNLP